MSGRKADEKTACKVCGVKYNMITPQHLNKHGLTIEEYKTKFPGASLKSDIIILKTEKNKRNDMFVNEEIKGIGYAKGIKEIEKTPIVEELKKKSLLEQLEKIPKKTDKVKKFNPKIEELNIPKVEEKPEEDKFERQANIPKNKLEILNYLSTKFPDVKNNFFVEKSLMNNRIEFKFITDIVILDRKIDIEFPSAFWHNFDVPKVTRDSKLMQEGWIIINIKSKMPTIDDVKKELEKNNLI